MSESASIPPTTPVPRRRRRWFLWLTLVFVLLVGLPLAAISAWSIRTTGRIDAELARIRAAGEPITAAELEAFYAPPPPERDVTRLWMEATKPLAGKEFFAAASDLPFIGDRKAVVPPLSEIWPQQK